MWRALVVNAASRGVRRNCTTSVANSTHGVEGIFWRFSRQHQEIVMQTSINVDHFENPRLTLASFRLVAVVTLLSKTFRSQVLPATIWQSVRAPGRHWLCPKRCFFSNLVEWVGKRIHMHSSSFLSFNDAMLRPNIIISNALLSALESMHLGYFVVIVHRSSRSVTLTQVQDVGVKLSTFCKGWKEEVWVSSLPGGKKLLKLCRSCDFEQVCLKCRCSILCRCQRGVLQCCH